MNDAYGYMGAGAAAGSAQPQRFAAGAAPAFDDAAAEFDMSQWQERLSLDVPRGRLSRPGGGAHGGSSVGRRGTPSGLPTCSVRRRQPRCLLPRACVCRLGTRGWAQHCSHAPAAKRDATSQHA
jgi:hypothetical protein